MLFAFAIVYPGDPHMPHSYIEAIQTDTNIYANLQDLSFGIEFGPKCQPYV